MANLQQGASRRIDRGDTIASQSRPNLTIFAVPESGITWIYAKIRHDSISQYLMSSPFNKYRKIPFWHECRRYGNLSRPLIFTWIWKSFCISPFQGQASLACSNSYSFCCEWLLAQLSSQLTMMIVSRLSLTLFCFFKSRVSRFYDNGMHFLSFSRPFSMWNSSGTCQNESKSQGGF